MRVKSLKIIIRVLVLGVVLGAASTAYADALVLSTLSMSNFTFTPATGTAQFTITNTTARALADNTFGEHLDNISNAFPIAQSAASVTFASAVGTTNANTNSLSGSSSANVTGCSCSASSFSFSTFTGTLVITGAEGMVDVNISALAEHLRHVELDQFGTFGESEVLFDLFVNGSPVFSFQIDLLSPTVGPNRFLDLPGSHPMSGTVRVQAGVENTIFARLTTRAWAINEVPEPATVVMLISGLGFMTGVLKKRRKKAE
jgi:hypothetical protein